jgi:acyl-homoserine-lactone acylase
VWTAGYYEAHVVVPGVLDFYGDLRIGGPFGVIGGFNHDLGWATTNNDAVLSQIYVLDLDLSQPDHYWLDGASLPLQREVVTVTYKQGDGFASESRRPCAHRSGRSSIARTESSTSSRRRSTVSSAPASSF